MSYAYDTYGRFNSLAGGGTTLAYSYTTNSNLLASVADTASGWTQTRAYLSNRDLLDVIETKVGAASKTKFDYAHDNLGRRTSVAKTGEVYNRYGNGTQGLDTAWGYDDRSQVTGELTKLGGSATVLTGRDDAYAWDTMGNRASTSGTTHNASTANYTTNALNQYTQRGVPGVFDVAGAAASVATVTVNSSSTGVTRHGDYFFKGHGLTNSPNAVFSTLAVSDGTTTTNLAAFLAATPEAFGYDLDGNLTSEGRWDYVYDAENRLVSMQSHATTTAFPIANADARRLEFKYDHRGRRVQKTVRAGWNGSVFTTVTSDEKFVYDGWNLIAKLNAASSNALVASHYWGLDWSGTLQGAGGVGGLALTVEGGNTYLPMFDGNGNVMGMIKASNGSVDAAYEYDAFGNTLRESGPYAASNPFRFSTKFTDGETGLVYYGHRYYSPTLGRFICRDPKEEDGGRNLYAFLHNNAINHYDYLGWETSDEYLASMNKFEDGSDMMQSSAAFDRMEANARAYNRAVSNSIIANSLGIMANAMAGVTASNSAALGSIVAASSASFGSSFASSAFAANSMAVSANMNTIASNFSVPSIGYNPAPTGTVAMGEMYSSASSSVARQTAAPGNPNAEPTAPNRTTIANANDTLLGQANLALAQNGGAAVESMLQNTANSFAYAPARAINFLLSGANELINSVISPQDQQMLMMLQPELMVLRFPTLMESYVGAQQFIAPSYASQKNSIRLMRLLDVVGDETVLGRLPNPKSAEAPVQPAAIIQTIDSNPLAAGSPHP